MPKPSTLRLAEIAELLDVSKRRAHQMADEPGFRRSGRRGRPRPLWNRREIQSWARAWRKAQPWR